MSDLKKCETEGCDRIIQSDFKKCSMGCGYELEIVKLQYELAQLKADNEYLNRQLADERSGIQDRSLEKHLRWENEKLKEKCAEYEKALEFYKNEQNIEIFIKESNGPKIFARPQFNMGYWQIATKVLEKWRGK